MVRKLKSLEAADDDTLVEAVCSSAHQIWQAGLGAFSRAQKEGGDMFSRLVQEGTDLQKRTQHAIGYKDLGVTDTVTKLAENVTKQATGSWEKLEKIFEERVSRSLRGLGVPTQDDVKALSRQIDDLSQLIAAMAGTKIATKAAGRKTTATASPAKRPAKAAGTLATKPAMKRPGLKASVKSGAKKPARSAASQA
jgi:poly(hydroxyalkanoate) granule-associated protein